jgi:acyl-CoA thioesterase FadM
MMRSLPLCVCFKGTYLAGIVYDANYLRFKERAQTE